MFRQLCMVAGYSSIFLMPVLLVLGVWTDHPYLAFGTAMLVFPLARGVFGPYRLQARFLWDERVSTILDRLPVVYGIALLVSVLLVLGMINTGSATSFGKALGIGLSLWMTMFFATCPAHELLHRRDPGEARIGRFIAGLAGYPFLGYEHLIHHARFGDTVHVEWPRLDESVWRFAGRRIRRIAGDTLVPGGALWRRRRSAPANMQTRDAAAVTLATLVAFAWAGGWPGLFIYLGVTAGVTFGMQLATYLQHWGLGDDSLPDAGERQFAWEDDCLFQAWMTVHISFHQSHHASPRLAYYLVALAPDSPRQPAGYVLLMIACLCPPLWRRLMLPVLQHWRRQPRQALSPGRRLTCFSLYDGKSVGITHR